MFLKKSHPTMIERELNCETHGNSHPVVPTLCFWLVCSDSLSSLAMQTRLKQGKKEVIAGEEKPRPSLSLYCKGEHEKPLPSKGCKLSFIHHDCHLVAEVKKGNGVRRLEREKLSEGQNNQWIDRKCIDDNYYYFLLISVMVSSRITKNVLLTAFWIR